LLPALDRGPLILKSSRRSRRPGVAVVTNAAELAALAPIEEPVFAQRYHAPDGPARKIYSIGSELFGVLRPPFARTSDEQEGRRAPRLQRLDARARAPRPSAHARDAARAGPDREPGRRDPDPLAATEVVAAAVAGTAPRRPAPDPRNPGTPGGHVLARDGWVRSHSPQRVDRPGAARLRAAAGHRAHRGGVAGRCA